MPVQKNRSASAAASEIGELTLEYSLLATLQNAFRNWWVLFALLVLGAAAGWIIHNVMPPVYEAVARFNAGIDYVATGPLTQFEEDTAYNTIGSLLSSPALLQSISEQLSEEGLNITPIELKKSAAFERRFSVWEVRVRAEDPVIAGQIASAWREQGQALLLDRQRHALEAERLTRELRTLERCLYQTAASEPSNGQCSKNRFTELQQDLQAAGQALADAKAASQGLFSGMTIGPADPVTVSEGAVLYGRGQVIFAGTMIGLLVGIIVLETNIPALWASGRSRRK